MKEQASRYNEYIRGVVDKSNGLVRIDGDPVKVRDPRFMDALTTHITSKDASIAVRSKLAEFMGMIPTDKAPYATLQKSLSAFISEPGNMARAVRWLTAAGVIEQPDKGRRDYKINMDNLNEKLAKNLISNFDRMGITQKYAERRYEELEQGARDRSS